jgi:hypothetical protein
LSEFWESSALFWKAGGHPCMNWLDDLERGARRSIETSGLWRMLDILSSATKAATSAAHSS